MAMFMQQLKNSQVSFRSTTSSGRTVKATWNFWLTMPKTRARFISVRASLNLLRDRKPTFLEAELHGSISTMASRKRTGKYRARTLWYERPAQIISTPIGISIPSKSRTQSKNSIGVLRTISKRTLLGGTVTNYYACRELEIISEAQT